MASVTDGKGKLNLLYQRVCVATLNTTYMDTTFGTLSAKVNDSNIVELMTNIRSKQATAIPATGILCTFTNGDVNTNVATYFPVVIQDHSTSTFRIIICYIGNTGQVRTREALPATSSYYTFYMNGINYNICRNYYNI